MLPVAHVILHVAFCNAILRAPAGTTIAFRVEQRDRIGRPQINKVYRIQRGDDPEAIVEYDSAFGVYRLDIAAPKYRCAATDYLYFISGHDRSITEHLNDAPAPPLGQPLLLSGTAPQSFLYVEPTFVLFDKSQVACNKPLPQPLTTNIAVENDQDGYYASLYQDPSRGSAPEQLALRLRTATHQYHYVRIPIPFPVAWTGWPDTIIFNVDEAMVDSLAEDPVDTLLCPKLWRTSAG